MARFLRRASTLSSINRVYKKTLGHKLRDFIAYCGHHLQPIQKYVFPNFIAVHYFYIISLTILCSILIYPVRDAAYIDILFISTGATTQGGLNTINVNDLSLYQQIIVYIICCISTPIAIHSALAFVRLYWFERHFDNIKEISKRNFKMRRTKTILEREMTARTMSQNRTATRNTFSRFKKSRNDRFQEQLFSGRLVNRDEQYPNIQGASDLHQLSPQNQNNNNLANEEDDTLTKDKLVGSSNSTGTSGTMRDNLPQLNMRSNSSMKIKGDLLNNGTPISELHREQFAKRRYTNEVSPQDIYKSIKMLHDESAISRNSKEKDKTPDNYEDSDEPIIVKGPREYLHHDERSINSMGRQDKYSDTAQSPTTLSQMKSERSLSFDNASDSLNSFERSSHQNLQFKNDIGNTRHPSNGGSEFSPLYNGLASYNSVTDGGSNAIATTSSEEYLNEFNDKGPIAFTNDDTTEHGKPLKNNSVDINRKNETNENTYIQSELNKDSKDMPAIHFDLTSPPKRPMVQRRSFAGYSSPKSYLPQENKSNTQKLILKQIKKGKILRQRLKRKLSSNVPEHTIKPLDTRLTDHQKAVAETPERGDNEDYFADNETDDDNENITEEYHPILKHSSSDQYTKPSNRINPLSSRGTGLSTADDENDTSGLKFHTPIIKRGYTLDENLSNLDNLADAPDFQKMVYEHWKNKYKKRKSTFMRPSWSNIHSNQGEDRSSLNEGNQNNEGLRQDDSSNQFNNDNNEENLDPVKLYFDIDEENAYGLKFDGDYNFPTGKTPLQHTMTGNYLSWQPTIGRNSTFIGLTKEQKDELGGVEYRAIKLLCKILVIYYIGLHIMGFLFLVPWIVMHHHYGNILRSDGVSPGWWGFFTSMSAFNDLGLTLTPDSMMSFNKAPYPLIVMMIFIILGNTGFPICLRFIIWVMYKLSPDLSQIKESLGFLLDHPRRCFTLLFPSAATWWLFLTLVALNSIDLVLFVILDFGSGILKHLSHGIRVLNGLFQAVSTRTAGFSVLNLEALHSAIQVSYMLMMYVSVLPLAISIRRTNVYEERSLGLYYPDEKNNDSVESSEESSEEVGDHHDNGDEEEEEEVYDDEDHQSISSTSEVSADRNNIIVGHSEGTSTKTKKKNRANSETPEAELSAKSYIGAHLRKQLSFDLWYLFLGLFIICLCENRRLKNESEPYFNVFAVLFEIVSAYGTVGLSLGYPDTDTSFSGQLNTLSKLVIIAMLIRGRNRGLPYSLDRAIMLPGNSLEHIDHLEDMKLRGHHPNDNKAPHSETTRNTAHPTRLQRASTFDAPPIAVPLDLKRKLQRWHTDWQHHRHHTN